MNWKDIKKPSFFLVGAAKSGTTSLNRYLTSHPSLYLSPIKEPNFFSSDIDPEFFSNSYRNTLPSKVDYFNQNAQEEIQLAFVKDEGDYQKLFKSNRKNLLAGECSTSYLYSNNAAEEIKNFDPNSKIIVILRDPLERAVSHYLMAKQMGLVSRSFEEEWRSDLKKEPKGWGRSELFFDLGRYGTQLKRYYNQFDSENILVLLLEEWQHDQKESIKKICNFLNVPIFAAPQKEASNKGVQPVFGGLHKFLMQDRVKGSLKNVIPTGLFNSLKGKYYKDASLKMDSQFENEIREMYREEILLAQELINKDLSNWLKK